MNGHDDSLVLPTQWPRSEGIGLTTVVGIELALVKFLERLFEGARLDNESLDDREVPLEGLERIQTLEGKVPPRIFAGAIPYTITGEIDPEAFPVYPSIVVDADNVDYTYDLTLVNVALVAGVFDRSKEREGRVDLINIMEAIAEAFLFFDVIGEVASLARKERASVPIKWRQLKSASREYFFGELIAVFELGPITSRFQQPFYRGATPPLPPLHGYRAPEIPTP